MKYDVIIIGSGLGGLACAHILSKAGKNVLVLEKEAQPGGCLQSYKRNGFTFDTGFHYVGGLEEGQSLYAAFKMLGLENLPWKNWMKLLTEYKLATRIFPFCRDMKTLWRTCKNAFRLRRRLWHNISIYLNRQSKNR